jgi:hypothetical protein
MVIHDRPGVVIFLDSFQCKVRNTPKEAMVATC